MKYTYTYKTSDGQRHEAAMEAPSREEVFATLRKQGIKAIKVVAADGSKANGEVRGVRKRVVIALVLLVAIGVGLVAYMGGTRSVASADHQQHSTSPRHQIYGDPVLTERMERGIFEDILPRMGDRLLAWFAEPGRLMCPKEVDPRKLSAEQHQQLAEYAKNELTPANDLRINPNDQREANELKQIVNGIRAEFRDYLANGYGSPRSFWRRLIERTQQEALIFERTRRELERETNPDVWKQKNKALRILGLRTIPNPNDAE